MLQQIIQDQVVGLAQEFQKHGVFDMMDRPDHNAYSEWMNKMQERKEAEKDEILFKELGL